MANDFLINNFTASDETVFSAVFTLDIHGKPTEIGAIKAEMETAVSNIILRLFMKHYQMFWIEKLQKSEMPLIC